MRGDRAVCDDTPNNVGRGSGRIGRRHHPSKIRRDQTAATQSISTSNGPCQAETQMKLRAGGFDGK
jgi:hypothetical protein